jgi:bifunctional non-homologous end joining protein LigD
MPARIEPQLANAAPKPPSGNGWLHEIKFDGYRTMAHLEGGTAKLITRSGIDWTKRYGKLAAAFRDLPCSDAAIDGEIVVLDDKGISRFAALQDALAGGHDELLVFYAFDLVHLNGWDLTKVALDKRKGLLEQLLAGHVHAQSALQLSGHVEGDGQALYDQATEMGLEGVVSKRASAHYTPGARTAGAKPRR